MAHGRLSPRLGGCRRPRRPRPHLGHYPRPEPVTYIPPIWLHDGCVVESHGTECVVYHIHLGPCQTTTVIVLYDPCRNVTFEVPYDTFRPRWRRAGRRSWGVLARNRIACRRPEQVEDGRW